MNNGRCNKCGGFLKYDGYKYCFVCIVCGEENKQGGITMSDRRKQAPDGYTPEEYGKIVFNRLPSSCLTYRETWCLMKYVEQLGGRQDENI